MVPWFDDNDNNDIIMMMMMMRTMIMWCRGSAEEWADAWRPTTHAITSQMQQFTPDLHPKCICLEILNVFVSNAKCICLKVQNVFVSHTITSCPYMQQFPP